MKKTLDELDKLAIKNNFGGAHNAITCAIIYRNAYSEYVHKYENIKNVLISLKGLIPKDLNKLIDDKT